MSRPASTQKVATVPAANARPCANTPAFQPFFGPAARCTKSKILRDRTGSTHGIRFRIRPPAKAARSIRARVMRGKVPRGGEQGAGSGEQGVYSSPFVPPSLLPPVRINLVQPCQDTPGDVHPVGITLLLEELERGARAAAGAAVDVHRFVLGDLLPARLELAQGDQVPAEVDLVELLLLPDVHKGRFRVFFEDFAEFEDRNFVVDHGVSPDAGPRRCALPYCLQI